MLLFQNIRYRRLPRYSKKLTPPRATTFNIVPQDGKDTIDIFFPKGQYSQDQSDQGIDGGQHTGNTVSTVHHAALTVGQIRHDPQGHQTDAPGWST